MGPINQYRSTLKTVYRKSKVSTNPVDEVPSFSTYIIYRTKNDFITQKQCQNYEIDRIL